MKSLVSTVPISLAYGLVLLSTGAIAQIAQDPDPNCPLPGVSSATVKRPAASTTSIGSARLPSGASIMTVKNPGPQHCTGGQCQMDVEVKSYTTSAGTSACCVRAAYGSFEVEKKKKDVVLRWNLNAKDSNTYRFNAVDGVFVISPPPNPGDFGGPTVGPHGKWFKIPSLNGRAQAFNYGFTIYRANADGSFLRCDPNDPLIVNQGQ